MTDDLHDGGRYGSLRDYLRVLRRYRVMLVLIAVIGTAAGYESAKRQSPIYDAAATVAFQDPTQNLSLVGLGTAQVQSPAQLAAIAAETTTRPQIMNAVKLQLKSTESTGALASAISTNVSSSSGLLYITAFGGTPKAAADLANAVADQLVLQSNLATQTQFARIASDTRRRIAALRTQPGQAADAPQQAFYEDELARLGTLSAFARSAQIANIAQPAATAVSPKVLRSTIIGLVLGILLAIAAAFGRDSVDRRLRTPHDVEGSFGLPVIGHVHRSSMGKVAYMANGSKPANAPDLESFRILRRNLESLDPDAPPKVVLVTSALAEEGKTTVATSLALAMAATGKRALLVDSDLRRPDLAGRIGVEDTPGLSDYLAGAVHPPDILRAVTFAEPSIPHESKNGASNTLLHRLTCIPAGVATSRSAELLGSPRFREFLEQVRVAYDIVILDSSPLLPVADTLEMLPHVDSVIVCAREGRTTRDQASTVKAVLSRYPRRPAGIVVTGIRPRRTEYPVHTYSHALS